MIEVEAMTRRWGNSIGITLPKEVIEKAKIKPNKKIKLLISEKKVDLSKYFGRVDIKKSTQESIDEMRRGEE